MAICRPEAIGDAPALRAEAQRRTPAVRLSWLARNGRSPGEESLTAIVAARRSRRSRPSARSSHREASGSRAKQHPGRRRGGHQAACTRGQVHRAKKKKRWRTERRSHLFRTRDGVRVTDTALSAEDIAALGLKRCGAYPSRSDLPTSDRPDTQPEI